MENKKYIGITIGPIFDTMSLTSSPVALWAASYMFSLLSKTICEKLVESGGSEEQIITPYYQKDEPMLNQKDGIGLFHDRIVFLSNGFQICDFNAIKDRAIEYVAKQFGIENIAYLKQHIMAKAVEFEVDELNGENAIIKSGPILDSLELAKPFVDVEDSNPILSLFSGKEQGRGNNDSLRNIPVISAAETFQLKKTGDTFKSILDIVQKGEEYKKYKYYTIIRSDGDNMSKIIAELSHQSKDGDTAEISYVQKVRAFSKDCLSYCARVAKKVNEYDGVTIYSGGDDLLAILPCQDRKSRTPFHFIKEANEIFDQCFKKYDQPTSLSFGLMMTYHKFPLYEALDNSARLLFSEAKKEKNCIAFQLQKHSGQAESLVVQNNALDQLIHLLDQVIKQEDDQILLSAMHKIYLFQDMFNQVDDACTIQNLFENVFDADVHKNNEFIHKELADYFVYLKQNHDIRIITNDENADRNNCALVMCHILRILKFYVEKGEEE